MNRLLRLPLPELTCRPDWETARDRLRSRPEAPKKPKPARPAEVGRQGQEAARPGAPASKPQGTDPAAAMLVAPRRGNAKTGKRGR